MYDWPLFTRAIDASSESLAGGVKTPYQGGAVAGEWERGACRNRRNDKGSLKWAAGMDAEERLGHPPKSKRPPALPAAFADRSDKDKNSVTGTASDATLIMHFPAHGRKMHYLSI